MQATDVEPSRFVAAQTAVSNLITDLPSNSQMTLIHVGHTLAVLLNSGDLKLDAVGWVAAFLASVCARYGVDTPLVLTVQPE